MIHKKVIVLITILLLSSCKFFTYTDAPVEIQVKAERFTIAWDEPAPETSTTQNEIKTYKLYYRHYKSNEEFILLDEMRNLEYTVTREKIDYGKYEFAVCFVDQNGNESPYHISTDRTADPITGWYLNWIGTK